ncbi:Hpt domain-containing protein [Desulfosediminicola ganghwensis]|uniref:hybrid sensor histidine kinase/response regulator n=1 Tax=Desulfosediminicola ganghwensis TaxID=2569540 RepID=UPI0010AC15C2|nr:Hpt domain-containing protein [Desulfosediminicola ganghwensis]
MRHLSQPKLANIFFREVGGYIPKIDLAISTLRLTADDKMALGEVYRYFHNIKGAASQVSHKGLSSSAGICEMLLGELIADNRTPIGHQLDFLSLVNQNIGEFCELPEKSEAAEESLFSNTLSFFKTLMHKIGPENPISLSTNMLNLMQDLDSRTASAPAFAPDMSAPHFLTTESKGHLDCLLSLRSVVPLLKELAEYSPESTPFHTVSLPPMIRAVKTLTGLTASAGLKGHHSLLSQFLMILIKLEKSPELNSNSTPELLQEFLSYLDLVFSMPPGDGEEAARKVQAHLESLCNLLVQRSVAAEPSADFQLPEDVTDVIGENHDRSVPLEAPGDTLAQNPTSADFNSGAIPQVSNEIPESTITEETTSPSSIEDELLEIFKSECDEHLQVFEEILNQLNTIIDDVLPVSEPIREQLALLSRAAHTLKGAAAMTGFDSISKCAASLECYLEWLRDDSGTISPADITLIVEGSDAITILTKTDGTTNIPDLSAINAKIEAIMARTDVPVVSQGSWTLEQPADAEFLLEINESDILLDISSAEDEPPAAAIDQDGFFANKNETDDTSSFTQQLDPELLAIFQSECDEHLQTIAAALNSLAASIIETTPVTATIRESLGSVRRAVHTLKGAAAMTGFDQLASCSHCLEDLLDWLHDSAPHIDPLDLVIVSEAIDVIESISLFEKASTTTDIDELINGVRGHLHKRSMTEVAVEAESKEEVQPEPVVQSAIIQDAVVEQTGTTAIPGDSGNIRVKLADLDELVNVEGELVVTRGTVEKLLDKYSQSLSELNTVKDTLRRKSQELEVGFEAQSLYGFGSGATPQETDFSGGSTELSEFDPIELDRYSQLNLIIRSLNEISIDINAIYTEMTALGANLQGQVAKQQLAMSVMQEKLMRIRMTPLSSISRMLHRTVRQTATRLGKNVRLAITGDDVYMDRFIWSRTIDPFSHILRNCIDHGIESSDIRTRQGKSPSGQITFHASQRGRFVVLKISDDGQGINTGRLRDKLIEEQLISADDRLSETELLPYLFKPSVTTRDDVSETSGRGVGLDVVLKNLQDLRGSVQIHNSPGKGVTFELRIPITLSVNRAIIFELSQRKFAVPIHDIVEVRKFAAAEIIEGDKVQWNDQVIPIINLSNSLQLPSTQIVNENILTLIVETSQYQFSAVQIEAIEEQREIVIKDLGSHLRYVPGINGVTLTGEGTIIPILNLHELAVKVDFQPQSSPEKNDIIDNREPLKVLVVDDSISVRYTITRLVKGQSWSSFQAVDGIDALETLENLIPDVIVLDIEMPRMNGFEFMAIIRNDERYKAIPVVMLTSRASEKHQNKAKELGVNHYMVKPFQEEDFIQLVSSMDSSRA